MNRARLLELREIYRRELFESVVPFWLTHSLDQVNGGQYNSLDRYGAVFDTDKSMWLQGRALWMFSKLHNEVEQRPDWLEAARHIYEFIMRCGFDSRRPACSSPSPPTARRCANGVIYSPRPSP